MTRVSIHVGKLVLHGLPGERARAIGRQVEQELARRVAMAAETAEASGTAEAGGPPRQRVAGEMARDVAREVGGQLGRAIDLRKGTDRS